MLIIVPMLAALWPGVRVVVNRYAVVATETSASLDRNAERLAREAEALRAVVQSTNAPEPIKRSRL
jgi:hypothetical protein